jgi:hypothetical protein
MNRDFRFTPTGLSGLGTVFIYSNYLSVKPFFKRTVLCMKIRMVQLSFIIASMVGWVEIRTSFVEVRSSTQPTKNCALSQIRYHDRNPTNLSRSVNIDSSVINPRTVMPDLIPAKDGIFDRHPERIESRPGGTGFLPDSIRDLPE